MDFAVDAEAPEVVAAPVHFAEHVGKGIERPEEGIVEEHQFVVAAQAVEAAVREQAFLPRAGIEARVGAHVDFRGAGLQLAPAFVRQLPVGDDDQVREIPPQVPQQMDDVVVHDAVGIVEDEQAQSFFVIAVARHRAVLQVRKGRNRPFRTMAHCRRPGAGLASQGRARFRARRPRRGTGRWYGGEGGGHGIRRREGFPAAARTFPGAAGPAVDPCRAGSGSSVPATEPRR